MPEMYEYALRDDHSQARHVRPGNPVERISARSCPTTRDGRMNSIVSRLLDYGRQPREARRAGGPGRSGAEGDTGWKAGIVFKALIDCRLGRHEQAQTQIRQFLAQPKDESIPSDVYWLIGSELEEPRRDSRPGRDGL